MERGRPGKGGHMSPTAIKNEATLPLASVLDVRVKRVRTVTILCPFCGNTHSHGWPASYPEVGSRVAHCGRGTYRVGAAS